MNLRSRRKKYMKWAASRGLSHEDQEDFAQEALLRWLNAGKELMLNFVLTDFLRATKGDIRWDCHRAKLTIQLDELAHEDGHILNHEKIGVNDREPTRILEFIAEEARKRGIPNHVWRDKLLREFIKDGFIWINPILD